MSARCKLEIVRKHDPARNVKRRRLAVDAIRAWHDARAAGTTALAQLAADGVQLGGAELVEAVAHIGTLLTELAVRDDELVGALVLEAELDAWRREVSDE